LFLVKGYLGDEEKTKDFFDEEGFAKVGDVGFYDATGTIFIEGRTNDMIK
jgi:long-subunit acyl-CoA synthetase (AMP-forming)